jgi:hypothetical protein
MRLTRAASVVVASLILSGSLCGCLVVGYSSQGGWWVWQGSLVVTLVFLLTWVLSRR